MQAKPVAGNGVSAGDVTLQSLIKPVWGPPRRPEGVMLQNRENWFNLTDIVFWDNTVIMGVAVLIRDLIMKHWSHVPVFRDAFCEDI